MTLFHRFAMTIILLGLIPMLLLSFFISNKMIRDYEEALEIQYEHAAFYVGSSIESMLDSYNTISQMPYNYNYGKEPALGDYRPYDNFRQIVHGDNYESRNLETERKKTWMNFSNMRKGQTEI